MCVCEENIVHNVKFCYLTYEGDGQRRISGYSSSSAWKHQVYQDTLRPGVYSTSLTLCGSTNYTHATKLTWTVWGLVKVVFLRRWAPSPQLWGQFPAFSLRLSYTQTKTRTEVSSKKLATINKGKNWRVRAHQIWGLDKPSSSHPSMYL